jgi:hypothetical protein
MWQLDVEPDVHGVPWLANNLLFLLEENKQELVGMGRKVQRNMRLVRQNLVA